MYANWTSRLWPRGQPCLLRLTLGQCGRGLAPDSSGSANKAVSDPPPSGASPLPQLDCGLHFNKGVNVCELDQSAMATEATLPSTASTRSMWEGACPR